MRTPLSWLRDFAPIDVPLEELVLALDDLGLMVEGVEHVGEGLDQVLVSQVLEVAAIPERDRIRRVVVDAGSGPLEIVCGAFNFDVGDVVALAPVGSVLPNGMEIGRRTMGGVLSNGMLCSPRELGLSEDAEGLLVLSGTEAMEPGMRLVEALGIGPDIVFDITIEGNRPDAWCMAGVARDVAARFKLPFSVPEPRVLAEGPPIATVASAVLKAPDLCPRLTLRVIESLTVGPSPAWMARRLVLAGMRPINNVVDASNYVMLELGQPTHPYDVDQLSAPGLVVRRAEPGEVITTLDGVEHVLGVPGRGLGETGEDCIICDAADHPVGIAGIFGGSSSQISVSTTTVALEAAYFEPMAIARTSKRLGLRTEASARFERGTDPFGIDRASGRFCELLVAGSPGARVAQGTLDVRGPLPERIAISLAPSSVNALLGTTLASDEIAELLAPIGFACSAAGDGTLVVAVPSNRPDVRPAPHGVADLAEEVARIFGYSRVERRYPVWPQPGGLTTAQRDRRRVRDVLVGVGACETWTSSLVGEGEDLSVGRSEPLVSITNPMSAQEASLRGSQLPGLLRAAARNLDRRQSAIRLFELGVVFSVPTASSPGARAGSGGSSMVRLPIEREMLSALFASEGDDATVALAGLRALEDELGLLGLKVRAPDCAQLIPGLHPTRSARILSPSGATVLGALGEVDPEVAARFGIEQRRLGWLEVELGLLLDQGVAARRSAQAQPVSRFPSADVDLAVVLDDEIPADEVAEVLRRAGGDLVESVALFDVYRGPAVPKGRRSLAFALRFCALDRTLTDTEIAQLRARCLQAAETELGAVLR